MTAFENSARYILDDGGKETSQLLAQITAAADADVEAALKNRAEGSGSFPGWAWIRLQNGDLALAVLASETRTLYARDERGNETDQFLAYVTPASEADVELVLKQSPEDDDGRSEWIWMRLQNGDRFLAVFPQGETYEAMEGKA